MPAAPCQRPSFQLQFGSMGLNWNLSSLHLLLFPPEGFSHYKHCEIGICNTASSRSFFSLPSFGLTAITHLRPEASTREISSTVHLKFFQSSQQSRKPVEVHQCFGFPTQNKCFSVMKTTHSAAFPDYVKELESRHYFSL